MSFSVPSSPQVLHVNISDSGGGVGKAAYRLHEALGKQNYDSWMWVETKRTHDPKVLAPQKWFDLQYYRMRTRLDKLPALLTNSRHWAYGSFNYLPHPRLSEIVKTLKPRIVHFHWIGDGLVPLHRLPDFRMPVVFTLHGRWLFNGAQHLHSDQSRRFYEGFNKDNRDTEDGGLDMDRWVWQRKRKYLAGLNYHVVALSRWMYEDAKKSVMFEGREVHHIPNGLDMDVFNPADKASCRKALGLTKEKKYILFGANFATQDKNKGYWDFVKAIQKLEKHNQNFEILVFGSDHPGKELPFNTPCHFLGFINEEYKLMQVYGAADCFVLTSKQDNLPNTVMEAMACGTPCIAYDVGGVSDMVEDQVNGHLVESRNMEKLADALSKYLKSDRELRESQALKARLKISDQFNAKRQATRMIELYESLLA